MAMAPYLIIYYTDIPEVEGSNIHAGKMIIEIFM